MAQHINDSNFDEVLAQNALVVVDFSATWCGPCRMLAPIVDELADEYAGRIFVAKADVEEAVESAERFGIRSVPTILFFKNGEKVDQTIGAMPRAKLVERFEALLA
ncbi:MAG: thioredoxin [Paludibacteraceae bacterium]|nr:thioredoxin [Bacteroidales bacterium]MDY4512860.1 thioredoxin [Paludibacteraceae bacterium]MCI7430387.1 thioredoxin [Bacteroidales bacterium]MDD6781391.1 thioredoxin [Bacteroidales bacterium]MDD7528703.1 thioredoxin [Bacteroidales bacterium]